MKFKFFTFLFSFLFVAGLLHARQTYIQTFGMPGAEPIVFLHGGPGGSSMDFEMTTGEKLAEKGFFVIVYDRRGEGRSNVDSVVYNFKETGKELKEILISLGINKANLLGHSFGGIVAAFFAAEYPDMVKNLVLTGTPVSMQESFKAILENAYKVSNPEEDTALIKRIAELKNTDSSSIFFSSGCFMLAMEKNLYGPAKRDSTADLLMQNMILSEKFQQYGKFLHESNYKTILQPSQGFFNNEKYTLLDIEKLLKNLNNKNIGVYGIYGEEDGLFTRELFLKMKENIFGEKFILMRQAGHGAYIDKQEEFISHLINILKNEF